MTTPPLVRVELITTQSKRYKAQLVSVDDGAKLGLAHGSFSSEDAAMARGDLICNGNAEGPRRELDEAHTALATLRRDHSDLASRAHAREAALLDELGAAQKGNFWTGTIIAVVAAVVGFGIALLLVHELDLIGASAATIEPPCVMGKACE